MNSKTNLAGASGKPEPGRHTNRKLWAWMLAGLAAVIGLILATESEPRAALQTQAPMRVDIVDVRAASLFPVERAVGRLVPARRATLSFELPGRVVERLVEPGVRVARGQRLVQLADDDARDRLREAEAQYRLEKEAIQRDRQLLALAEQNTALQREEVERLNALKAKSLTSRSQFDASRQSQIQLESEEARLRNAVATAAPRLDLRKTQRDQAKRNLKRTALTAPFAGTVNRVEVDVGDYVSQDQPIVALVDLVHLDLYVEARGNAVRHLKLGQTLDVTVGGRRVQGRLHSLQPDPHPSTYTHGIRIRLAGEQGRPGDIASVELPLSPLDNVLVVPPAAVLKTEGKTFVFRYAEGKLQRTPVTLGARVDDMQVIEGEISKGDPIVARDVAGLGDGQTVTVASGMV